MLLSPCFAEGSRGIIKFSSARANGSGGEGLGHNYSQNITNGVPQIQQLVDNQIDKSPSSTHISTPGDPQGYETTNKTAPKRFGV